MKTKRLLPALVVAAGLALALLTGPAFALLVEVTPDQLAAGADAVIRGQVATTSSRWNPEHTGIVTDVTIRVTETWTGSVAAGASTIITIAGGEVPPVGMSVDDQPEFRTGEDVVVFLALRPEGGYGVFADIQGKLTVEGNELVSHAGLVYPLEAFRQATEQAAASPQGSVTFPEGAQGPPTADDNYWAYCGQKWFPGRLPYTWLLNSSGAPGSTFSDTQAACQTAMNTWICASGITTVYGGSTGSNATNHSDGLNVLAWEYGTLGSGTIALCTRIYWIDTNEIFEIDIQFNATHFTWSTSGSATAMDVQSLATHEIGHTLCLGDLYGGNDTNKTMYGYGYNGEFIKRSLHTADGLGAEWIYPHTRANFAAGTPAGWSNPLVPRNTADANGSYAPLPSILYGNTTSYVNLGVTNNGGDCASPQGTGYLNLDGEFAWSTWWSGVWNPGFTGGLWTNLGTWIRGGRHSLLHAWDTGEETLESNEGDNYYYWQYVWSPLVTSWGVPNVRPVPPDRGLLTYPNSDGQSFTRGSSLAWVASVVGLNAGDDYDLYLYDDFVSSTSGFSNLRGSSAYGGNAVDFVVGHWSGTPTTVYPAEIRYATTAAGYYTSDQTDSYGRYAVEVGSWPGQYLADYRLTDMYEAYLTAGVTYYFHLARTSGTADIGFTIFPSTAGGIYGAGSGQGYSWWIDDATDALEFTPTNSGWHPVVVYRSSGLDPWGLTYDFSWDLAAADAPDVPDGQATAARWSFSLPVPNPTSEGTRLRFELPSEGPVRLNLYDAAGRQVRGLVAGTLPAGAHEALWDGKNSEGHRVAAGVYWARLEATGRSEVRMITVVQ